jgi:hypothetical protein
VNIYQDESGCLGFKNNSSRYFAVALLCPQNSKHLSNLMRKFKGSLIMSNWPKNIEVKAHNLFMAKSDPRIPNTYKYKNSPEQPIFMLLNRLDQCDIEIDGIIVLKDKIKAGLRTLPYGILFNYFSARVLVDRIITYEDVHLYVDETSKQTHDQQTFDVYIKNGALLTKGHNFPLEIVHGKSHVIQGISAVDFIVWSLFRKYESNDSRFLKIVKNKFKTLKTYYFKE